MRYIIKFRFSDETFGETDWRILCSEECENITHNEIPTTDNTLFSLVIFIATSCIILLCQLGYSIAL